MPRFFDCQDQNFRKISFLLLKLIEENRPDVEEGESSEMTRDESIDFDFSQSLGLETYRLHFFLGVGFVAAFSHEIEIERVGREKRVVDDPLGVSRFGKNPKSMSIFTFDDIPERSEFVLDHELILAGRDAQREGRELLSQP